MLTAEQIRAARAMLRLEQTALAERAGVSVETIKRLEGTNGQLKAQSNTLSNIRTALELLGVEFTDDDQRPGVRLCEDRTEAFVRSMTEGVAASFRSALRIRLQNQPLVIDGDRKILINEVLQSLEDLLKQSIHHRLPGKNESD